ICLSSTNIHFDYDGHYSKCGDDYEWIPTNAQLRKKAHVVGTMVSVRVDIEKKRMWALIWNRRNIMNIPRRNTRGLENDNHIFKWVDEAFTDEIRQLDYQVRKLEEEVQVLKETIRSEGPKIISGGRLILGLSVVVVVGFGFFDVQVIPKAMTKLNFLFFLSFSYVSPKLCEVERL
ncbi:unnamed protein product, partial [Brassica oleracea var. botrytis]